MQLAKRLTPPKVFIIGLGWLGLPLSSFLKSKGKTIAGTVTSVEKQKQLVSQSINAELFNLYEGSKTLQDNTFIQTVVTQSDWQNTTLVLAIPPGRKNFDPESYTYRMQSLIDNFMENGLFSVIFISTSAVYGNTNGKVDNNTPVAPVTASAIAHVNIERHLSAHYQERSVVLRLTGLVGPKPDGSLRHPIFTLSNKKDIAKGKDPVNLIHQVDVIAAINALVNLSSAPFTTAVLSSLAQPSRQEYYPWCSKQLGLPTPHFISDPQTRPLSKSIDANDTFKQLGIEPLFKSPYDMLEGYI